MANKESTSAELKALAALTSLAGVGKATAEKLIQAGIKSAAGIRQRGEKGMVKAGVSVTLAKKILSDIPAAAKKATKKALDKIPTAKKETKPQPAPEQESEEESEPQPEAEPTAKPAEAPKSINLEWQPPPLVSATDAKKSAQSLKIRRRAAVKGTVAKHRKAKVAAKKVMVSALSKGGPEENVDERRSEFMQKYMNSKADPHTLEEYSWVREFLERR
jgi:hypothetical protein